jgi:hypothetical protein
MPPAVRNLLQSQCLECHGGRATRHGLDLTARARLLRGGDSSPVVRPGNAQESKLYRQIIHAEQPGMPYRRARLSQAEVKLVAHWINAGAPYDRPLEKQSQKADTWWSLRPVHRPSPPDTDDKNDRDWPRTPLDCFILAKLQEKSLRPSPPADRRTWLRRVTYDLTGLPPTRAEQTAFLADASPLAEERVVDRLLASPHYGERWARHWMDVAHYAETHGHDQDRPRPNAWPYRDYLIRSFNLDKPYARFVEEQLAGDILYPDSPDATVALGFLATGPWDESSLRDIRDDTLDREIARYLDRDDMVTTAISTFASSTVHCARCHDHKFDPIAQEDYYGLQAVFAGVDKAERVFDLDARAARQRRLLLQEQVHLQSRHDNKDSGRLRQLEQQLAALPPQQLVYAASHDFKPDGTFRPTKTPRTVRILKRGDITKPGPEARPGALPCVPGLEGRFRLVDPNDEGSRRAALAQWLTDPRNVLTWRSIVNRIWHYHFGRGLVDTPNDFGRMGSLPTHPELLDWLTVTFLEHGGSLKYLHRLIVTSAVYRQSSQYQAHCAELDADNRYLWRMQRTRLDAEEVRDSVLQVAGKLNVIMGGPSVKQFNMSPGIHVTPVVDYVHFEVDRPENYRRSVYRFLFRTLPDPFMEALDCADSSQLTAVRTVSVTPLQALAMLNDKFMIRMSEHLAERIGNTSPDRLRQVQTLYQLTLGREPTGRECAAVCAYVARYGLGNACRIILNSNEFLFIN